MNVISDDSDICMYTADFSYRVCVNALLVVSQLVWTATGYRRQGERLLMGCAELWTKTGCKTISNLWANPRYVQYIRIMLMIIIPLSI